MHLVPFVYILFSSVAACYFIYLFDCCGLIKRRCSKKCIISGITFEDNPFHTLVLSCLTGPDRDKENMDTLEPEL